MSDRQTLDRLAQLEERALFHVGSSLERPAQILEGRRRIAVGAAWLTLARDQSDHRDRRTLNSVGYHLRSAQRILERQMAE